VGKENIDASLGLAFSLALFERYQNNGLLHAELQHVPGIRGRCKGFLHLIEGSVVSCYIEDKHDQRHSISKDFLVRVDKEHGPFEWTLAAHPVPLSEHPKTITPLRTTQHSPIPKTIAPLDFEKLESWTLKQKLMLSSVYDLIDGVLNIDDIKSNSILPTEVTEEALRVLLFMKLIVIMA
jgi:hypothetical protein